MCPSIHHDFRKVREVVAIGERERRLSGLIRSVRDMFHMVKFSSAERFVFHFRIRDMKVSYRYLEGGKGLRGTNLIGVASETCFSKRWGLDVANP